MADKFPKSLNFITITLFLVIISALVFMFVWKSTRKIVTLKVKSCYSSNYLDTISTFLIVESFNSISVRPGKGAGISEYLFPTIYRKNLPLDKNGIAYIDSVQSCKYENMLIEIKINGHDFSGVYHNIDLTKEINDTVTVEICNI